MGITFITKTSSRRCKKKILDYYDIFKILLILLMIINLYITLQKLIIHCKRVTKIASDQCYNCNIKTLKMQIQFVQLKTSQSLLSKLRLANHCLPNENQPIISFFFILFLLQTDTIKVTSGSWNSATCSMKVSLKSGLG